MSGSAARLCGNWHVNFGGDLGECTRSGDGDSSVNSDANYYQHNSLDYDRNDFAFEYHHHHSYLTPSYLDHHGPVHHDHEHSN